MEAGKQRRRSTDAGPTLLHPPKPLGSGESPLYPAQRRAVIGASVAVALYAVACLSFGWDGPVGTVGAVVIDGLAGVFSILFLATVWLGASKKTPTGFQVGRTTYLAPRETKAHTGIAVRAAAFADRLPWQLREPLFRLPVLLPIVWGAATFASVHHQVRGDIHGQLEPTLIALLTAVIAINGFLAVRGQHTIDFVGALATVLVLIAGTVISLVQIAGDVRGQVQWVAAALVFGLVAILQAGIRGADSPDGGKPAPTEPPRRPVPEVPEGPKPEPGQPVEAPPAQRHRQPSRQCEICILVAAGVLAGLVLLGFFLWLVVRVVSWGTTREAQVLHSATLLCGVAAVGFGIAGLRAKKPTRWSLAAVVNALLATAFGLGGSWVQKHLDGPPAADCLAFDAQFGQLVGDQTQAVAVVLSNSDQRHRVCMPALEHLKWPTAQPDCLEVDAQFAQLVRSESLGFALRAMEADGRRAKCRSTLGRIEDARSVTDCVAFLAQLDELVDDEPINVAAVAIEHDPRTPVCHPRLGLLARR